MNGFMRSLLAAGLCLVAQLTLARAALAGPPYTTDDPDPTDFQHFEIYTATQYANSLGGPSGTLPLLEINYGLLRDVQFSVDLPIADAQTSAKTWRTGLGDSGVGVKLRFINETDRRPEVAFYPSTTCASGDASTGLGAGHPKTFLPLWSQKTIGPYTVFGGGGLWLNPGQGNKNSTFFGIALVRQMTERWSLGAETFRASADTLGDTDSTGFNVGSNIALDRIHSVLFSVGRSLRGDNRLSTYAAYEWQFGLHRAQPGVRPLADAATDAVAPAPARK